MPKNFFAKKFRDIFFIETLDEIVKLFKIGTKEGDALKIHGQKSKMVQFLFKWFETKWSHRKKPKKKSESITLGIILMLRYSYS